MCSQSPQSINYKGSSPGLLPPSWFTFSTVPQMHRNHKAVHIEALGSVGFPVYNLYFENNNCGLALT